MPALQSVWTSSMNDMRMPSIHRFSDKFQDINRSIASNRITEKPIMVPLHAHLRGQTSSARSSDMLAQARGSWRHDSHRDEGLKRHRGDDNVIVLVRSTFDEAIKLAHCRRGQP